MANEIKLFNRYIGEARYQSEASKYVSAQEVVTQLEEAAASDATEITIYSGSPGGRVDHGMVIQNAIARLSKTKPINGVIDGPAASMGYLVLLPCTKIEAYKNILIMTHGVQGSIEGSAEEIQAYAESLKKYNEQAAQYLADRTGLSVEECIQKFLKAEKWWTAQEALDAKLIDGIIDVEAQNIPSGIEQITYNELIQQFMAEQQEPKQNFIAEIVQKLRETFNIHPKEEAQPEQALIDSLGFAEQEYYNDLIYAANYAMRAAQYVIANGSNQAVKAEAQTTLNQSLATINELVKKVYGEKSNPTQQAETIFEAISQKYTKEVPIEVPPTDEKIQQVAQTLIAEQLEPLQAKVAEKEQLIKQLTDQVIEFGGKPAGTPETAPTQKQSDMIGDAGKNEQEQYMTSIDRIKQKRKQQTINN